METKKIIVIRAGMADPQGKLIPKGVREQITIQIADEIATYFFRDKRVTKNFSSVEIEADKAKGIPQRTFFLDRPGKALRKYPGMKKEEIRDLVLTQLNKLGVSAKIFNNNGKG